MSYVVWCNRIVLDTNTKCYKYVRKINYSGVRFTLLTRARVYVKYVYVNLKKLHTLKKIPIFDSCYLYMKSDSQHTPHRLYLTCNVPFLVFLAVVYPPLSGK